MDITLKALRDITTNNNKPPANLIPKCPPKPTQATTTVLPYISNLKELRNKEEFSRNNKGNISMEASAERTSYQLNDHYANKSFELEGTRNEAYSVLNGISHPRRAGFTRNLLQISKEKNVFAGARLGEKAVNYDIEEKILSKKLQEARDKKESIIKMMTENEKKQKEREALQERIGKLRGDSARKIQLKWRAYKQYKAFKKYVELNRIEALKNATMRCDELLSQLNQRLLQENRRINKNIVIIQRSIRKFLAKKKLKILWKRKTFGFIDEKVYKVLKNCQMNRGFEALKSYIPTKIDNFTFFVTSNPVVGCTMPTQDSDFEDTTIQVRNLRYSNTGNQQNMSHLCVPSNQNCKRHNHVLGKKGGESMLSLGNSITSLHGTMDQKPDSSQGSKLRSSRFCTDGKSIGNINETINPEDEKTARKAVKSEVGMPPIPRKSHQHVGSVNDCRKHRDLSFEKKVFKV